MAGEFPLPPIVTEEGDMNARALMLGTAIAGTLDILGAIAFGSSSGMGPITVLQSVAAGPFGDHMVGAGPGVALLGLAIHYAIMFVEVAVFIAAVQAVPGILRDRDRPGLSPIPAAGRIAQLRKPILAGVGYGLIVYCVMYWIVLPLRWPTAFPQTGAGDIATAVFLHIFCVGIPIALCAAAAPPARVSAT